MKVNYALLAAAALPLCGLVTTHTSAGVALTNPVDFDGTIGSNPEAGLTQGSDGSLYGTTTWGGAYGLGTIFKIAQNGAFSTMVSFDATNGAHPWTGLVSGQDGNFYGTTFNSLNTNSSPPTTSGPGTVFKVTPEGVLTTLVYFDRTNGANPDRGLVLASDGNLYGVTQNTIFQMTPGGALAVLDSFIGSYPDGSMLTEGADGSLYGTTYHGGTFGLGSVYRITTNGVRTMLASLNSTNGAFPLTRLRLRTDGDFLGTTIRGGDYDRGTVFRMTPGGIITTLHSFTGGSEGVNPMDVIEDPDGTLYGGTYRGGAFGNGTIFRLALDGTLTTLYAFTGGADGANLNPGLVRGSGGNFYGTTALGGLKGSGTVFRLSIPIPPVLRVVAVSRDTITLGWSAVVGETYQVQYICDLAQTNWSDLSPPLQATNETATASDSFASNMRRFYRVGLLQ